MRYRSRVGSGPSSNTCPKCEPQFAHSTSVRRMNRLRSSLFPTLPSWTGAQKLGQPVPESNLVFEAKSSRPQTTHTYTPGSWLSQYSPVKGRSVPLLTPTWYCNGVSCSRSFARSNFSTKPNAYADDLRFWRRADFATRTRRRGGAIGQRSSGPSHNAFLGRSMRGGGCRARIRSHHPWLRFRHELRRRADSGECQDSDRGHRQRRTGRDLSHERVHPVEDHGLSGRTR